MIRVALLLALVLIGGGPALVAAGPPELLVQAPAKLAGASGRIARLDPERVRTIMALVGVSAPGPPIRVILAPEGSPEAEATPSWVLGVAYGSLSTIVLFPERTPSYPDGSFEEVLLHEIAHVLIARAAGFQQVPRWFDEGLAMVAATKWSLADRSWLTAAAMLDSELPLAKLDQRFASSRVEVARAYALAGAFMRDLFQRSRPTIARDILARRALGLSFDDAFRRSLGASISQAESAFWRRHSLWFRWVPFVTSSFAVWLGIVALALLAGWRKRRHRARLEEVWEEEEAILEEIREDTLSDEPIN